MFKMHKHADGSPASPAVRGTKMCEQWLSLKMDFKKEGHQWEKSCEVCVM